MDKITNINQLNLSEIYSYSDYLKWEFSERIELLRGRIFKMSPAPATNHQRINSILTGLFFNYFENKSCEFFTAPFDVRLLDKKKSTKNQDIFSVVQPDLCVICDSSKIDKKGCLGAPDLIVEILSPGNSKKELSIKFDLYEENKVKEYWIINPIEKNIFIYVLQNDKFIGLKPQIIEDKIYSPLFPDLNFELNRVFKNS